MRSSCKTPVNNQNLKCTLQSNNVFIVICTVENRFLREWNSYFVVHIRDAGIKKRPSLNTDNGDPTMEDALLPTLLCWQATGVLVTFFSSLHGSLQAAALPQETAMRRVRRLAATQPLKEHFCWNLELPGAPQRLKPLLGLLLQLGSEMSKGCPPWGGLPVTWSCSPQKYCEVSSPFSCPLSPHCFVCVEVEVVVTTPQEQIGHFPPQLYRASNFQNVPQGSEAGEGKSSPWRPDLSRVLCLTGQKLLSPR